jgi:hypothetical protein
MNRRYIHLFFLAALILPACVTTKQLALKELTIQVLESPDSIKIKKGTYIFLNRIPVMTKSLAKDSVSAGILMIDVSYFEELSWVAVNSSLDVMELSPVIENVILDTVSRIELSGTVSETVPPLDTGFIRNLTNLYQADGVIALEEFHLFDTVIIDPLYDNRSKDSVIWAYYATEYIYPGTRWRVYNVIGDRVLDYSSSDTLAWDAVGDTKIEAESLLFPEEQVLHAAMKRNGKDFGKHNFPYWINVKRVYYTSGSEEMKAAAKLAESGDWLGAAEIWKKLVTSEDRTLAAHAAFNMAIVSEINDNLNMALVWINQAWSLEKSDLNRRYGMILRKRVKAKSEIAKQIH